MKPGDKVKIKTGHIVNGKELLPCHVGKITTIKRIEGKRFYLNKVSKTGPYSEEDLEEVF